MMSEETITDDQSHYEVSLTAGQAFLAFVLLLLSLAASFAFGLMIGRGQGDDRLLAEAAPAIVDEAAVAPPKKPRERIVELGISDDSGAPAQPARTAVEPPARAAKVTIKEETAPPPPAPKAVSAGKAVPHYAQILSTSDQKKAEALAAKLIDGGFLNAYVDRTAGEKGQLYRVRVNFPSEDEARGAETRLKAFSKDVWITKQ
ncbi:MAG TPA: SPOR domain-containing protein [Thermoanaerobaculia bacterium]|nr:SPOR domain-containing protein [Thermoanaerobaculia bacterium]